MGFLLTQKQRNKLQTYKITNKHKHKNRGQTYKITTAFCLFSGTGCDYTFGMGNIQNFQQLESGVNTGNSLLPQTRNGTTMSDGVIEVAELNVDGKTRYWDDKTNICYDPETDDLLVECPSCYTEVHWEKMAVCSGHPAGCQKCHMELIKVTYESGTEAFNSSGNNPTNCQKCFLCRKKLGDTSMGRGWSRHLLRLQGWMVPSMFAAQGRVIPKDTLAGEVKRLEQECLAKRPINESDDEWYDFTKVYLARFPPSAHRNLYELALKNSYSMH